MTKKVSYCVCCIVCVTGMRSEYLCLDCCIGSETVVVVVAGYLVVHQPHTHITGAYWLLSTNHTHTPLTTGTTNWHKGESLKQGSCCKTAAAVLILNTYRSCGSTHATHTYYLIQTEAHKHTHTHRNTICMAVTNERAHSAAAVVP